ncbi:protein of unknown function [Azospirillum baldaniorum]|uniref:Uncharacterized protein n=1 Tax=Azospirillum baldaniorum TaxID=1064539 RepID=A0A9P1JQG0_9PROT|nr:protein of unknown function [Azospirillum baldaniorum]
MRPKAHACRMPVCCFMATRLT